MTTTANSTTVYESPCGRVKVVREGPKDYSLYLDGMYTKSYARSWDAEHDGGVWLHEQATRIAADLADERATYDHYVDSHTPEKAAAILLQEPFGRLSNGAQIVGDREFIDPSARTGVVHAAIGNWYLTAQNDPDLINISGQGMDLWELTIADVNALRALLATDIPEQLIAAAVAYGCGVVKKAA